ncbi:hypothetical protein [Clostridioides difficile]|nr:hypothetical protein [Clostridioides difficile]
MELKFREWNKNGKEMYSYDEMVCYSKICLESGFIVVFIYQQAMKILRL